uniref:Uncharacterized protein n=1 Tax=Oryza barthii TaxID=65489 RepID=A0A0D3GFG2_9ORYZ
MQAFLRAAEVMKKKDELLKVWAEQICDLSYDIEDSLDEFKVHIESQNLFRQMVKLRERHRIAIRIHNLKSRVEEVSSRNTRYSLVKPISSSTEDDMDSYAEDIRNLSARNVDEAELVGFSDSKKRLLEMIDTNANDGPAKVICVVGMGGLGKTALSRKIFESEEDIRKNFPCNAWITVSQSFHRIELLKDMIRQLLGPISLNLLLKELQGKVVVQVHHLSEYLLEELKEKRYFVVLDDLWFLHDWNWINDIAFPKNNKMGSRIVITTRSVDLAEKCATASLVYHLDFLQMNDAITLLLRKTNKKHEDMESNKNMQNMVERIVNKCGRLPLAILTIGAVLATKHVSEWEKFYEQLPSELEINPSLEALRRMVTLGYNHLPSHLKPCFLYLSIFPEDFEIKRNRLVGRWIAEGFVRPQVGMTTKDVGESYFNELISRSMIQRSRVGIAGKIQSCRVHDIIRDITVSISRQENFVLLPMGDGSDLVQENTRHIAFHGSMSCKTGLDWSIIRSLAIFGDRPKSLAHAVCPDQLRMLRVLDLEDVTFLITQKDFDRIALLCHLKYLSIGYSSCIYSLPRSIGKLQGLQTLNMLRTYIAALPSEISKLQCLHTLRCIREFHYDNFSLNHPMKCITNTICLPKVFTPLVSRDDRAKKIAELHMATKSCWSESYGVKVPKGIGRLRDLHVLEYVDIRQTSSRAIKELGQLSKLRKLGVITKGSTKEKCKILYAAIEKLCSLQSLHVGAVGLSGIGTLECLDYISSPPPLLRTLRLNGSLEEMPNWIEQLTHLKKFYLWRSKLKEGKTMLILGALPNLMLLSLYHNSYLGEKLVFKTGAFPNLRTLQIYDLDQLREIRFEDGSSPLLEEIEIGRCLLKSGIIGIIHLPRLKEISLGFVSKVARLGQLEGELNAHPNRPMLRTYKDRSYHDLGAEAEGSSVQVEAADPLPDAEGSVAVEVEAKDPLPEQEGESLQVITLTTNDRLELHDIRDHNGHFLLPWERPRCHPSTPSFPIVAQPLGVGFSSTTPALPTFPEIREEEEDAEAVASSPGPPSNTCCAHRSAFLRFTTVCAQFPPECAKRHREGRSDGGYSTQHCKVPGGKCCKQGCFGCRRQDDHAAGSAEGDMVWVQQVRDISYDIEDCLDEFTVHVGNQTLSRQLMKLKDRHRIAIQICNLRTRIEEISTRNMRYNLIENDLTCTIDERNLFMEDIRNLSANNIEEADLVGFSGPKRELLDLIDVHANIGPTKVVCVVGMGGLGKTTIARKIYESKEDIAKNFSCCAWITVSQSFVRLELLKDLMMKLFGEEVLKKQMRELEGKVPQVDDLTSYLRKELNERRYFVVLDDSIDSWKWINSIAFPRNNNKGSRVIVTTRDVDLAKECTSELLIYQLKPLEINYAKELLLRKANKTTEDMESDKKMSDIITKIVKKCGYLPLAILTIGGVLVTKEVREWETFYCQIPSELESNPNLEAMRRIVTLSYNYLPSHLKQCFLYLSIFPEDFEINRNRLVNRWIAEGFIKARTNMTIEDVGKSYFKELINRSMIQPSRAGIRGDFKSCRVHDIMSDITISISREENFTLLPEGTDYDVVHGNTRHIAFNGSKYCSETNLDWSIIRSLTMFGERSVELEHSVCSS